MSALYEGQVDIARLKQVLRLESFPASTLLLLDFRDRPLRLSNRTVGFTDKRGARWQAGGGLLVGIPEITFSLEDMAPFREYHLGLVHAEMGDGDWRAGLYDEIRDLGNYQDQDYALLFQVFDPAAKAPIGNPFVLDAGRMSGMALQSNAQHSLITLTVEAGLHRGAKPPGELLTYRDQLDLYTGDEGLEFTTEKGKKIWTQF